MGILKQEKVYKKRKDQPLTQIQIDRRELAEQLVSDSDWLIDLSQQEEFSQEWLLSCSKELLLQCMGKKAIVRGDKVVRAFKENSALRFIEMIAQLKGYLIIEKGKVIFNQQFNTISGQQSQISPKPVELEITDDRAEAVLRILQESGAMQSSIEEIAPDQSIEILPS